MNIQNLGKKLLGKKLLALVCIAALLATGYADPSYAKNKIGEKTYKKAYIKAEDWPDSPKAESVSAVLIDAETGTVLYAKNPDTLMYPASITKIMTALLTLENCNLSDKMVFSEEATQSLPYNAVSIDAQTGEKMSIRQCLNATLVYSANDAASGLACEIAGSIDEFSKMMNERAKELGCKNTHFNNPHGLSDDNHWTTAYDMCQIMKECIKYDDFREIASTRLYTIKKNNKRKESFTFAAKHKMLFPSSPYYYEYIVCGKTGYTQEAVNTLVTYAEKDGRGLICCVMKAGYGVAYTDTKALFEYGFNEFKNVDASKKAGNLLLTDDGKLQTVSDAVENETSAELLKGTTLELTGDSKVTLPKGVKFKNLDMELESYDEENKKDSEESCFGQVVFKYQNTVVGRADLKMLATYAGGDGESETNLESDQKNGETGGLVKSDSSDNVSAKFAAYMDEVKSGQHMNVVLPILGVILAAIVYAVVSAIRKRNRKNRNQGHSYRL